MRVRVGGGEEGEHWYPERLGAGSTRLIHHPSQTREFPPMLVQALTGPHAITSSLVTPRNDSFSPHPFCPPFPHKREPWEAEGGYGADKDRPRLSEGGARRGPSVGLCLEREESGVGKKVGATKGERRRAARSLSQAQQVSAPVALHLPCIHTLSGEEGDASTLTHSVCPQRLPTRLPPPTSKNPTSPNKQRSRESTTALPFLPWSHFRIPTPFLSHLSIDTSPSPHHAKNLAPESPPRCTARN